MRTLDILFNISQIAILIPILLLLIPYKRQPTNFRWFAGLLICSVTCDFAASVFVKYHINPNYMSVTYNTISPVFYGLFFYHSIGWFHIKKGFIIAISFFVLFSILNFVFIQKSTINSNTNASDGIFTISLCMLYFYRLIKDLPDESIHRTPVFWMVCAMLFTASTKMILFSFAHFLIDVYKDNLIILAQINLCINIIFSILVAYGAYLQLKLLRIGGGPSRVGFF